MYVNEAEEKNLVMIESKKEIEGIKRPITHTTIGEL